MSGMTKSLKPWSHPRSQQRSRIGLYMTSDNMWFEYWGSPKGGALTNPLPSYLEGRWEKLEKVEVSKFAAFWASIVVGDFAAYWQSQVYRQKRGKLPKSWATHGLWWGPPAWDRSGGKRWKMEPKREERWGWRLSGNRLALQQDDYLVTKSSDQIFFCRPISILGNKIFYLSSNINLRRWNLYFIATFQNIDYIGWRKLFSSPKVCLF